MFGLKFASWVAGRKLSGPGAQAGLPTGRDVLEQLGAGRDEVEGSLSGLIGPGGE